MERTVKVTKSLAWAAFLWLLLGALFAPPVSAYTALETWDAPAAWPTDGQWIPYSYLGAPFRDLVGNPDQSKTAQPTGAMDVSSGAASDQSSTLYCYSSGALFFRLRLNGTPQKAQNPEADDGPYTGGTWVVLLDTDGDGYREYVIIIDGNWGKNQDKYDRILVFYANDRTQYTPEAANIHQTQSCKLTGGVPSDSDPSGTVWDWGRTRVTAIGAGEYFFDIQVPLNRFDAPGAQLTASSHFALAYSTANSNTDPFQKDIAFNGIYNFTDLTKAFAFGDSMSLTGEIRQEPVTTYVTVTGTQPEAVVNANVVDTLALQSGDATSTVQYVDYYYQPDGDGDGTPDAGTTPTYIGRTATHDPVDIGLWVKTWDLTDIPNGTYDVWCIATDTSNNVEASANRIVYTVNFHTGWPISGSVYLDANQSNSLDGAEAGTGTAGLYAKIAPDGGGDATEAVAVDATTGAYRFVSINNGTYRIIIDDNATLTDTTPYALPSGWIGTEEPDLVRDGVTMSGAAVTDRNFGLYAAGRAVSGRAYHDQNHNAALDYGETGTGIAGLYAKIAPQAGGNAVAAAEIDPVAGTFQLVAIPNGTYRVILDDNGTLTDTTACLPAGWLGMESPAQAVDNVTVNSVDVTGVNFGLWPGSKLSGTVYRDTGDGAGTANDGTRNGTEQGVLNAAVKATDEGGGTVYDTTVTDGSGNYTLYVPGAAGSVTLKIVETTPSGYVSSGGSAGTTGGAYDRATDTVTFTNVVGTIHTAADFGDVPENILRSNGAKTVTAGCAVFYPHSFTAGTAGQVTFSTTHTATPADVLWSSVIYRDTNGNGALDAGEPMQTDAVAAAPGEVVYLIVKDYVPPGTAAGAQDQLVLSAAFTYTGASPALAASYTNTDLTTVQGASQIRLVKEVSAATARSGDTIIYTITYQNDSGHDVTELVINDSTPAYTTFKSAAFGALPAGLTGCAITSPAVGEEGAIVWTFTGTLAAGATGTVTFQVLLR